MMMSALEGLEAVQDHGRVPRVQAGGRGTRLLTAPAQSQQALTDAAQQGADQHGLG
jgi:hypothetical protein